MPTSFSQQEIADILRHEERQSARPQPVTLGSVGVQVAQSLVAGLGAALLLGGGAALLGAPSDIAMQVGLTSAVLATGTGLVLRIVPDNKLATVNRESRSVDATLTTESPVLMYDWRSDRLFEEVLLRSSRMPCLSQSQRHIASRS